MGSLTSGWGTSRPGAIPPGFEDYADPAYVPRSPRSSSPPATSSSSAGKAGGPPSLARTSAPPVHGASTVQRYLARTSSGGCPSPGSPRSGQKHMVLRVGGEEEGLPPGAKEKWCSRMESASLNLRPDDGDEGSWRHGTFRLDDSCHTMHILPSSTAAAAAAGPAEHAVAESAAPVTPPAAPGPSHPRVTVQKLADAGAASSFASAAL